MISILVTISIAGTVGVATGLCAAIWWMQRSDRPTRDERDGTELASTTIYWSPSYGLKWGEWE